MGEVVTIENAGAEIVATNYWESETARRGALYVSVNAGAFRLLVPRSSRTWIEEMRTAREVVISRGPWPAAGRSDALELLFDDGSDDPFSLQVGMEQVDRVPLDAEAGWRGRFLVYEGIGKATWETDRVFYRRVDTLPCLKAAGR